MSSGMPELGSKISLISKADIRYEGRLFTVDPQECTIALASVRSFGTEDREAPFPVAPQNQVYDYILFRGSDIKDIRVVNNVSSLPNDPAIMQLSVPPSLTQQAFQSQGFQHPVLGAMPPQLAQFNTYGMGLGAGLAPGMGMPTRDPRLPPTVAPVGGKPGEQLIIGSGVPPPQQTVELSPAVEPPRPNNDHASVLDLISGGSRSTTPASLGSRKSPTADQGVQAGGKKDEKKTMKPIQPPSGGQRGMNQRDHKDSRGETQEYQNRNMHRNQHQNHHQYHHQQQHHQQQHHQQQNRNQSQRQGSWTTPRGYMRQRGRPRGGYNKPPQGGGPMNQQVNGGKPKNTLKFENDYDFEQANTEFAELRSQLTKVKLDDGKPEMNGDSDKKDDSGNETGAGEGEPEEEHEVFYDKAKSFFDNISCEAVERSKGRSQRTDWRIERKLNSETFGVSATRRGGYRGRGGFRGMGYRGNYRGNYNNRNGGGPQRRDQQFQQNGKPIGQQNSSNNKTNVQSSGNSQENNTAPTVVNK